jgi:hypothetical protein
MALPKKSPSSLASALQSCLELGRVLYFSSCALRVLLVDCQAAFETLEPHRHGENRLIPDRTNVIQTVSIACQAELKLNGRRFYWLSAVA